MYIGEQGVARLGNGNNLLNALRLAKQRLQTDSMHAIKLQTGWELGVDGLWRYEYTDPFHPSIIIEDYVKRHHDEPINIALCMIDHTLLEVYPNFARLRLFASYTPRGRTLGYFSPANYGMVVTMGTPGAPFDEQIEGILLHEVQHLIQQEEDFAKGGDASRGRFRYLRLAGEVEARNVVIRHRLSAEERRNKLRTETQDVPDREQIIVR